MPAPTKCGVLLVNTGTPEAPTPRAVRKYLGQFLMDPRIAPMNRFGWWFIVRFFILPSRGKTSAEKYRKIWSDEGSPLMVAHDKITAGLTRSLANSFPNAEVRHAMSYGEPNVVSALQELEQAGCKQLLILPMYPQSAYSTTGAVHDGIERALKKTKWDVPYHLIDNYHDNPAYLKTIAASIKHAGFEPDSGDRVLFALHSVPLADIEAGDTYELQVGASCLQIASELGIDRTRWTIGYQSRFETRRSWLSPFSREVLDRWAEAGTGRLFYVCPGFAVDCLETLYDIEYELEPYYHERTEHYGTSENAEFVYVPCLDRSKAHVNVIKNVLEPYLERFCYEPQ